MQMQIEARGLTDIGQVRATNQDTYLIDSETYLYIVADGMGGHAGGEVASSMCVELVSSYVIAKISSLDRVISKNIDWHVYAILSTAINRASTKIYERALEDPKLSGMGTTVSLLLFMRGKAYVAHVGDSRIYLVRSRFIYQLTNDHSLANEYQRRGEAGSRGEANKPVASNIITRSVGYQEEEDVDTHAIEVESGDLYVLSSDGLHAMISDAEISLCVSKEKLDAVPSLVNLANKRDGKDNITVVVVSAK